MQFRRFQIYAGSRAKIDQFRRRVISKEERQISVKTSEIPVVTQRNVPRIVVLEEAIILRLIVLAQSILLATFLATGMCPNHSLYAPQILNGLCVDRLRCPRERIQVEAIVHALEL